MANHWVGLVQKLTTNKGGIRNNFTLPNQSKKQAQTFTQSSEEDPVSTSQALPSNKEDTDKKFTINLTEKLSPDVAILHIYADGSDEYRVLGIIDGQEHLETKSEEKPNISLGKLVECKTSPPDIGGLISVFSSKKPQISRVLNWLSKLQKSFKNNQKLYLIIADHTDFEIPWEILKISENEHLGSAITTARWQYISCCNDKIEETKNLLLDVKTDICKGSVMSYINSKLDPIKIKGEMEILKILNAQHYNNIHNFFDNLKDNNPNFALIFIASHGNFGENILEMSIEGDHEKRFLGLMELHFWRLNLFKSSESIVFINACHSGRLRIDNKYKIRSRDYRTGFATYFLEQGARGVIGTLGEVGIELAPKIAHRLIEKCHVQNHSGNLNSSVAELLREERFDAVKKLMTDNSQEAWRDFIFTFMYVYYGNPKTILELTPLGGQPNV